MDILSVSAISVISANDLGYRKRRKESRLQKGKQIKKGKDRKYAQLTNLPGGNGGLFSKQA